MWFCNRVNLSGPLPATPITPEDLLERDLVDLVRQHHPRLIRLAGLICRNAADAEDAVQAGLEQAWRRRDSLRDPSRLAGWLNRIVVREAIRQGRRDTSRLSRLFAGPREIEVGPVQPADHLDSAVSGRDALRTAFDSLPAAQRAVVALHLYEGYSMAETAQLVGVSLETARSRLRLARERLRAQLRDDDR
jgi:RNA polymerase sigma-70 factor (ECF subfamily)